MEKPFDLHDYSDIIDREHHTSSNRRRMSNRERGAQFSPFAALTGYGSAVSEAGRLTEDKRVLTEDVKAYLDAKLQILSERIDERAEITVTFFKPDLKKAGGSYVSQTGYIREIDPILGRLTMSDRSVIEIEQIRSIEGELFAHMESEI